MKFPLNLTTFIIKWSTISRGQNLIHVVFEWPPNPYSTEDSFADKEKISPKVFQLVLNWLLLKKPTKSFVVSYRYPPSFYCPIYLVPI